MSRYLGRGRPTVRNRAPAGRAERRAWKGCDPVTGAPLSGPRGLLQALPEHELAAGVMDDIRRVESRRQFEQSRRRPEWSVFDDDLFNRR